MVSEIGGGDMPPGMKIEKYAAMLDRRAERMALMQAEMADDTNHPDTDTTSENTVQPAIVAPRIVIEHRADAGMDAGPPKFEGYSPKLAGTAALAQTVEMTDTIFNE